MGVESYKHQFAKATLAGWLRDVASGNVDEYVGIKPLNWRVNRGGPHYGVWVEYPICLNKNNWILGTCNVWDENDGVWEGNETAWDWSGCPPTYDECIKLGLLPIAIFDVAIQHKGIITYGLEVVHRNGISDLKSDYLQRIKKEGVEVFTIDADWILSRVKRPTALVCQRVT